MKLKDACSWKKSNDIPIESIKKQRHYFAYKGRITKTGFSSSHVLMWELDRKEGWVLKNWCLQTVVLEKTLESPLDNKDIWPAILKEINPEYSLKRLMLMLKLKLQYFGHLMQRANYLKDPDAEKDWGQEEKETTEDEMVGWHDQLNGHLFEQTPGDGEGQGSLECCSPGCCNPWGSKEWYTTERLNNDIAVFIWIFYANSGGYWYLYNSKLVNKLKCYLNFSIIKLFF